MTMLYGDINICNDNGRIEYDKNVVRDNKLVIMCDIRQLRGQTRGPGPPRGPCDSVV